MYKVQYIHHSGSSSNLTLAQTLRQAIAWALFSMTNVFLPLLVTLIPIFSLSHILVTCKQYCSYVGYIEARDQRESQKISISTISVPISVSTNILLVVSKESRYCLDNPKFCGLVEILISTSLKI